MNIFSFEGQLISIVTTQLCPNCVKAAIEYVQMNEHGYVPIKLYL